MPEKPKRRKNNKNKRKNKNNKPEPNKNNVSDVKESDLETSVQSECLDDSKSNELQFDNDPAKAGLSSDYLLSEEQHTQESTCSEAQCSNQDHNNNSENVESTDCLHVVAAENIDEIIVTENYIVESPEQSQRKGKRKVKLDNKMKSKSLDNDEETKIEEIIDENCNQYLDDNTMAIIDSNVLVSDVESDVEWEKIDEDPTVCPEESATGTLSITTIPLNIAQCEHTKSLTPDEEMSLRHYLQTLSLSTNPNVNAVEIKTEIEQIINREIRHRLRKKGLAEDFIATRVAPPRMLDVIDEESSESSLTSRRQSYLSDKISDNEDLEDDVFEKPKSKPPLALRSAHFRGPKSLGRLVPQECVLVGAKLKEPGVAEARGNWTVETTEKMKGAELVYLTDSSSSTSSIHEIGEETDDGEDTDVTIRMITPTIEVIDTDNLLKKTYVSESDNVQTVNSQIEKLTENLITIAENQFNGTGNTDKNLDQDLSSHEIIVSSIDNIQTDLYVKDVEENDHMDIEDNTIKTKANTAEINVTPTVDEYDNEIKVLKSELNDAINNLIKEVCSDSENNENPKDNFVRQDSSSSIGSSQCTAKYNPTYSSLNDVSNILHDETCDVSSTLTIQKCEDNDVTGHVKDVFECVTGSTQSIGRVNSKAKEPKALRDICVQRIAVLPYGDKILEELASVSERLQKINTQKISSNKTIVSNSEEQLVENMPYYPLPDVSAIEKVSLPIKFTEPHPPPIRPRNSSLKKSQDDHHWTAVPTKTEPVYICLSPSQKMLMEKTHTVVTKEDASQLADMHKKYVDRRGYNEPANRNKQFAKNDDSPIVPFKSQTGSRLLALIRDPSVTDKINSTINNRYISNDRPSRNYYADSESSIIHKYENKKRFEDLTQSFKPIPPPRPKKYSSSFYESDESSDFTDNSLRSFKTEKKVFHYSTGNLSKDIENDISSIQNMHRYHKSVRDSNTEYGSPRRPSLPKDLCDQQMEYIRQKEKEVEAEIRRLEQEKVDVSVPQKQGPRAPLITEKEFVTENVTLNNNYYESRKSDNSSLIQIPDKRSNTKLSSLFSSSQEELLRDKMYSEYITQMAQRQERKQHKVIKITNPSCTGNTKSVSKSMSALDVLDSKVNNRIEKEFISKARERWTKLGITDPETEDERENDGDLYREPNVIEHKIKVIEGGEEKDVQILPSHLQEFVNFTAKQKEQGQSSSGESGGCASPHVAIWCAVIILVLAVVKYFLRMFRNM